MRALTVVTLLALGSPLAAFADGDIYQPPDLPGTVAVYRGGSASNVEAAVPVYRGSAARRAYQGPAPAGPEVGAVGGQRLWFVDPARDELVACRMARTFTVGVERIRCVRRPLPAG